jgi:signal transduction histidine kinase
MSAIYSDMLGVMEMQADNADIGFHFYEGLARLVRKLHSSPAQPLHQMWAAAEEFRLLFDAHAVWLRVPDHDRGVAGEAGSAGRIWEVATLTERERELLAPLRDGLPEQHLRQRRKATGIRWDMLKGRLSQNPMNSIQNSNLASVDGVLVLDVPGGMSLPWQLTVFMEHQSTQRATIRESSRLCKALVPNSGNEEPGQAFRTALSRISLPFGEAAEPNSDDLNFWPVDRTQFKEESERLPAITTGFCDLYRNRFRSIHTVLERIYKQMDALLAGEKRAQDGESTLIFSYRAPEEDFICFFPTVHQARHLIDSGVAVQEFLDYWQFPYKQNQAISGWVLATGTCDYTECFDTDGRWKDWINNCNDDERPSIEKQLERVRRFFRTGQGGEQKFMYLIPIVLRPSSRPGANSKAQVQLQPILMASIGSSKPLAHALRRQLYDLAWDIAPAVEMALFGQNTLERVYQQEAQIQTVGRVSAAFAHEVGQPLNALGTSVENVRILIQDNNLASDEIRGKTRTDLEQAKQSIQDIVVLKDTTRYVAKLAGGGLPQKVMFDLNTTVSNTVSKFQRYCGAMWGEKIKVEVTLSRVVGKVLADASMIETMMQNLMRNAMEVLADATSGLIKVSTERADERILIKVKDDGPGIPPWLVQKLNRGEAYSTKPLGVGLGYMMVRLICTAHGGTYLIKSEPEFGTLVTLDLPINVVTCPNPALRSKNGGASHGR